VVVGIILIGLDAGRGRCCGGRRGKRLSVWPIAPVTIVGFVLGGLARLGFLSLTSLAGGSLRLLLLLAGCGLGFLPFLASPGLSLFPLLASLGLSLVPLLASGRQSLFLLLASLGLGFFLLLAGLGLGLFALATSSRLGLLALAAGRGLGLLAILPVRRGDLLVREWRAGLLASGLDDGRDGARSYCWVVDRRAVRRGGRLGVRLRLGDDVAGRLGVTCAGRRVFW
jgi:hypothetical protein